MRPRYLVAPFAALVLASCSPETAEPTETSPAETSPEVTVTLEVAITDVVPIDFTLHSEKGTCWVHLANDAPPPDLIVEDAEGTVIATESISTQGVWGDHCTVTTEIIDVPSTGFYTIRLEGTVDHRSPERIEFETTVQAAPVDGVVTVEWTL